MAVAPGRLFGRAFSAATASSHAAALREVMYTFEQPAWRRLLVLSVSTVYYMDCLTGWFDPYPLAACRPNPLDPPVTTATLPSSEKMDWKLSSWTCSAADMVVLYSRCLVCDLELEMRLGII